MSKSDLAQTIAVVITTCDNYQDLWGPFFQLFNRFWPDCPYPQYLVTDEWKSPTPFKVKVSPGGGGLTWSKRLKNVLTAIPEDYVLLLVEDLFLKDQVNNQAVVEAFQWGITHNVNCIQMNADCGPSRRIHDIKMGRIFGESAPGVLYRASSVFTFWKKQTLIDLLEDGESIWDFEVYGTVRSDRYPRFYASRKNHFPNYNGVIKGLWRRNVVSRLRGLGIKPDLKSRPMMTPAQEIGQVLKIVRSEGLKLCPSMMQRRIKEVLLRGKYDYRMAIKQSQSKNI